MIVQDPGGTAGPAGSAGSASSAGPAGPAGGTDPLELALRWLPGNDAPDRPQMTLGTVDIDGAPAARTVLLSSVGFEGFTFHTDARSEKVADLRRDPRVSLVIVWPGFFRQLVVQGTATEQSQAEARAAFARRSPYLRHLAVLNDGEFARRPLEERRSRWAEAVASEPVGPLEPPATWVGFTVTPRRMLFWESAPDTASRRTEFVRDGDRWRIDHLPG